MSILLVSKAEDYRRGRNFLVLMLLVVVALGVSGYHPGVEDDGVYLPAIKRDLNPALYPHDSDFFTLQLQATVFDKFVASSVRFSHVPLDAVLLAWHVLSIFLVLSGCWRISIRCFPDNSSAQWAAVATVGVLLTLPVSGSALYLVDQHLHPRALATAAVLGAIVAVLDRKRIVAVLLLAIAFFLHPIMASFGVSICVFMAWDRLPVPTATVLMALPLGWIFEPTSPAWQQAANTRDYLYLSRWHWYEWLGVFAPLVLLFWFHRMALRNGLKVQARVAGRLVLYSSFQFAVAVAILSSSGLDRLRPLQPMRYLHLLYLLFVLLGGGLIGQHILRNHVWRWLLFFIPLGLVMFAAQRQTFPATRHLELPGFHSGNAWVEAFIWVKQNTPVNSIFALDPYYMNLPGEDSHSFRALAERSALADNVKDPSVATQVPRLADIWQEQVVEEQGWQHFQPANFQRLRKRFGVGWVVLELPGVSGLDCPYQNSAVRVCRTE